MGVLAVIFWPRPCLGQEKVAFGNLFVWILSILICAQNSIKISHMAEDLRGLPYFQFFCFDIALGKEKWHLEYLLARSCQYLSVC